MSDNSAAHLVFILAETRSGAYRVETAADAKAMEDVRRDASCEHLVPGCNDTRRPLLAVWWESNENEACALARAAEVRAWPQQWQRSLIEAQNPQWLDVGSLALGFPSEFVSILPEREGMPYRSISQL